MSDRQLMHRLISTESTIAHQRIRNASLSANDFHALTEAAARIYEEELWIDDTPRIAFSDLRNRCRQRAVHGLDVVFIDYLTLVKYGDPRTPRYERVGELSAEVKALASELQVPVIALSQINRMGEKNGKPTLDTLRQSGEIEENADVVLILHRESRDNPEADLIIAKHRNAPTGEVPLYLQQEFLRFENSVRRPA
jgi:replicative DNA helicase